jgi:hypothetical protein
VIFTDEWGGGSAPRCLASDLPEWGANAIFDIAGGKHALRQLLQDAGAADGDGELRGSQRLADSGAGPRHQGAGVVPGRHLGLRLHGLVDPVEIAYFDRGPISADELMTGGYWSSYWYNGHIYGSEIIRGFDVLALTPSEHLSQNEIDAAKLVRHEEFNPQHQPKVTWPPHLVVAQAYLDQGVVRLGGRPAHAGARGHIARDGGELNRGRTRPHDGQEPRDRPWRAVPGLRRRVQWGSVRWDARRSCGLWYRRHGSKCSHGEGRAGFRIVASAQRDCGTARSEAGLPGATRRR